MLSESPGRGGVAPADPPLHQLSLATSPVTAFINGRACWQGSGFLFLGRQGHDRYLFLITVRHLLTPEPSGVTKAPAPDTVTFQLRISSDDPARVRPVRVPLYTRDGDPVWLDSRTWPEAEVAVIPVPGSLCEGIPVHCIDRTWSSPAVATVHAGMPLHVIGFPYSSEARPGALPVWHAGSLASDPGNQSTDTQELWGNVPPFPGMAGAPAVAAPTSPTEKEAPIRRLIGVYAGARSLTGRTAEEVGVQNGISSVVREFPPWGAIWRAQLIDELIENADLEYWQREVLGRLP